MARVVVDVMPKPEILDPQGKAVTGALARLGFSGMSVRQGKRFELELDGEVTEERLAEVRRAAETLLANTVIETFDVRVEEAPESSADDGAERAGQAEAERAEETEAAADDKAEPSDKAENSDEIVTTDVATQTEAESTEAGPTEAGPADEADFADEAQPAGDEAKSPGKAERDGDAKPVGEAKPAGDEAKSPDQAERDGDGKPVGEAKPAGDAELAKQAG